MPEYKYPDKLPSNFLESFLGEKKNRVAVLGSYDAWPYIHKICVDVIKCGFAAVTSRYIYRPSDDTDSGYYRTKRDHDKMDMNRFLREKVIEYCDSAIIIYSSPGTNYNEAEWCNERGIRTLGINITRAIQGEDYCEDCLVAEGAGFSYCCGEGDAWLCGPKKSCPFKEPGMSKSQLDYFLMKKDGQRKKGNFSLISIEKLEKTTDILNDFLMDRLNLPEKLSHVFEFRLDLSDPIYSKTKELFESLSKKSEDSFNALYEYVDYYYKPVQIPLEQWFTKKHSLRIRRLLSYAKEHEFGTVFYTQLEQTPQGFYCKEPFGKTTWFEGKLETAKSWLHEIGMDCFLKVIKVGQIAYIPHSKPYNTKFKVFLETIEVETQDKKILKYGNSLEVELWTDKPKNTDEISQKKSEILRFLKLENCPQKSEPVQEFVHGWLTKVEQGATPNS